jgi:uncharacterized membrane protein
MHLVKRALKYLMAVLYLAGGLNHFLNPGFYLRMMPPWLPWHEALVALSGVAEMLLGALVLVPRFQRLAAWGLIALLVAVFPANVHMALHPGLFPEAPPAALWGRLPLQGLLILWAWWFTRPEAPVPERAA